MGRSRVAIGEELKACTHVVTLGVRPQISDYTADERKLLRTADVIFYPTIKFVDIFAAIGKETFPSVNCYRLQGERLKQAYLFRLLKVLHPRTRVYYGHEQKQNIVKDFSFPFVAQEASLASGEGHGYLIKNRQELYWHIEHFNPVCIQEYLPRAQELRVAVLNYRVAGTYWQELAVSDAVAELAHKTTYLTNGSISEAISLATHVACAAGLSDVIVKMVVDGGLLWVTGLDFGFDGEGSCQGDDNRLTLIMKMIEQGEL